MLSYAIHCLRSVHVTRLRSPAVAGAAVIARDRMKRVSRNAEASIDTWTRLLCAARKFGDYFQSVYMFYPVKFHNGMCINYGHKIHTPQQLWRICEGLELCTDCGAQIKSHADVRKAMPLETPRNTQVGAT